MAKNSGNTRTSASASLSRTARALDTLDVERRRIMEDVKKDGWTQANQTAMEYVRRMEGELYQQQESERKRAEASSQDQTTSRINNSSRNTSVNLPSMPKKNGSAIEIKRGNDTYRISHLSTGYGSQQRTSGTFNITLNGEQLTRVNYNLDRYTPFHDARSAWNEVKRMLRR